MEGGIPPLVELLEFIDTKVQRAAAGALRTLAFKNDENKNQVTDIFSRSCTLLSQLWDPQMMKVYAFCRLWNVTLFLPSF